MDSLPNSGLYAVPNTVPLTFLCRNPNRPSFSVGRVSSDLLLAGPSFGFCSDCSDRQHLPSKIDILNFDACWAFTKRRFPMCGGFWNC